MASLREVSRRGPEWSVLTLSGVTALTPASWSELQLPQEGLGLKSGCVPPTSRAGSVASCVSGLGPGFPQSTQALRVTDRKQLHWGWKGKDCLCLECGPDVTRPSVLPPNVKPNNRSQPSCSQSVLTGQKGPHKSPGPPSSQPARGRPSFLQNPFLACTIYTIEQDYNLSSRCCSTLPYIICSFYVNWYLLGSRKSLQSSREPQFPGPRAWHPVWFQGRHMYGWKPRLQESA